MEIYFNWLGKWIEINDDIDYINDMRPSDFIMFNIVKDVLKNTIGDDFCIPIIIKITKDNQDYHIPLSQLVWKE